MEAGAASEALFKMAALDRINHDESLTKPQKVELSVKYQVLCDETAMVGVLKRLDKATGQLMLFEMNPETAPKEA